ncbi:MAG TPA: protein kinase [Kofleriaceae bacterium]|nr:protein kinase [Kofleriaceae bacterium]
MSASPSLRRQPWPAGYGPGVTVGTYRITGVIGRGGMGAVYAAEHTLLGRPAAIKVLLGDLSQRQDIVLRFFNEARAAAAIRHPGIVEIYDVGWGRDGAAYIVMEHLIGEGLGKRVGRGGRLPWRVALGVARQIAGALAAAHGKGIVHRDLKPDNVFLVPDPEVPGGERIKLLDFGIAKLTDGHGVPVTKTGVVLGTPTYMAPEQCRGVPVDHRADLYALGCLIFRVCTGRPPFVGAFAADVLASHVYGTPPLLGPFVPEAPPTAEVLVQRLLAKRPEDRLQRAEEVIQQIDKALQRAPTPRAGPRAVATALQRAANSDAAGVPDAGPVTAIGAATVTGSAIGAATATGPATAIGAATVTGSATAIGAATPASGTVLGALPAVALATVRGAAMATGSVTSAGTATIVGVPAMPRAATSKRAATAAIATPAAARRTGYWTAVWLGAAIATISVIASIGIATCGGPMLGVAPPIAPPPLDRAGPVVAGPPSVRVPALVSLPPSTPADRSGRADLAGPADQDDARSAGATFPRRLSR